MATTMSLTPSVMPLVKPSPTASGTHPAALPARSSATVKAQGDLRRISMVSFGVLVIRGGRIPTGRMSRQYLLQEGGIRVTPHCQQMSNAEGLDSPQAVQIQSG